MRPAFEDQGWEDYTSWLKNDRKTLARINKLIEDVRHDPFSGIGRPEPLKYPLPGAWSRRIDDEHRRVYLVTDKKSVVLAARYRYRTLPRRRPYPPASPVFAPAPHSGTTAVRVPRTPSRTAAQHATPVDST